MEYINTKATVWTAYLHLCQVAPCIVQRHVCMLLQHVNEQSADLIPVADITAVEDVSLLVVDDPAHLLRVLYQQVLHIGLHCGGRMRCQNRYPTRYVCPYGHINYIYVSIYI